MELQKVTDIKINGKSVEAIAEYSDNAGSSLKEIIKYRGEDVVLIEEETTNLRKQIDVEKQLERQKLNMLSKLKVLNDKKDVDPEEYSRLKTIIGGITIETDDWKNKLKDAGTQLSILTRESKSFAPMGNTKLTDQIERWKSSMESMMSVLKRDKNVDDGAFEKLANDIKSVTDKTNNAQEVMKQLKVEYQNLNRESTKKVDRTSNLKKESEAYQKLTFDIKEFQKMQNSRIDSLALKGADTRQLDEFRNRLKAISSETPKVRQEMKSLSNDITVLGRATSQTSKTMEFLGRYFGFYEMINLTKRAVTSSVQSVLEMDTALTELAKVSDLSGDSLKKFSQVAAQIGSETGRTLVDATNAIADFARAGYDVGSGEATMLGKNALILKNIGDGVESMEDATSILISTMKGFNISANESIEILNKVNNTSNNTSVGFAELADGLSRSSAIMNQSGTSIDETISMLTAGFAILQDMPRVSTSLNTLALRIRSVKDATGDLEIDGETVQVAKFRDEFDKLGVSLMDSEGQIRDFYDIMKDLAEVFPTLDKNAKASFASIVGGARNGSVLLSVLQNWDESEKALEASINSRGSAMRENEIFINSLQGKLNLLSSAWKELGNKTLDSDFLKRIVDLGTSFLKLSTNMGGLVPTALALSTAMLGVKTAMQVTAGTGGILNFLKILNIDLITTTGSAVALKLALGGIGVGLAIGGIAYAINEISKSAEKTRQKVAELKTGISDLQGQKDNVATLANRFEELSKKQSLSSDEYQEWLDIQNEIKAIMPELNGYYDEQGNFIITQAMNVESLNAQLNEYIRLKKEELKVESGTLANKAESEIEINKRRIDALRQYGELAEKLKSGEINQSQFNVMLTPEMKGVAANTSDWKAEIKQLENDIKDSTKNIKDHILNTVGADEVWYSVSEPMRAGIAKALSEMDLDGVTAMRDLAEVSSEEFIKAMSNNNVAIEESNRLLGLQKSKVEEVQEAQVKQTETASTSQKTLNELYKDNADSISEMASVMEDLAKNEELSEKSINTLVEKYPELLAVVNDEAKLREELTKKIAEQRVRQESTMNAMIANDENYYNTLIATDENARNIMLGLIEQFNIKNQEGLQANLNDFTTIENAKLSITNEIIQKLSKAWQQYFNVLSDAFGQSANLKYDMTPDNWNSMSGIEKAQYQKAIDAAKNSPQAKYFQEMYKQFEQAQKDLSTLGTISLPGVKIGGISSGSGSSSKSGSGSGSSKSGASDLAKQIKDALQSEIDKVQKERLEVDYAISMTNAKLDTATLKGDMKQVEILNNEMNILLAKRKDLTAAENVQYGLLKKKFTDTESLATLEKLMKDNSLEWHGDLKNILEQEIGLLAQKYELERKSREDLIRDTELQQAMLREDSQEYADLQQIKYNVALANQKSYMEQIEILRKKNYSDTSAEIQALKKLYYDAENDKIALVRWSAEQRLKLETETVARQKKGLEDLQSYTMQMIKAELEAKKKALQDELSEYEKIINAKKNALREESDEKSYQDTLSEKQKALADIEKQLIALENDNSDAAKVKRIKLEEEKAKAIKELEKLQYDHSIELQEKALDKELESFKDKVDTEVGIIDDQLNDEVALRKKANEMIERNSKALYDKLIKYAEEYGTITTDEVTTAWNSANEALAAYGETCKGVLETQKALAEAQNRLDNTQWQDYSGETKEEMDTGANPNTKIIKEMMANAEAWKSADADTRLKLAQRNLELGDSIGAYRDPYTGEWYTDKTKRKKLFGVYHTGLERGQVGTGLRPDELLSKLTKKEWVLTEAQMNNLNKNIHSMVADKNKSQGSNLSLHIEKLISVDKMDKDTDLNKLSDVVMGKINKQLSLAGYR